MHTIAQKFAIVSALALFAATGTTSAWSDDAVISKALAHPERSSEERADDPTRKPLEVLSFAGLAPGMKVLELEASGGWYTEILSRVVGHSGHVVMQNPPAFESFTGDKDNDRADRLDNVTLSTTNFDALEPEDSSIDLVTWILGPHELWFAPGGQSLGDPSQTFSEIARVLKTGGHFLAIDHQASDDAGVESGGSLHRINDQLITQFAAEAGLKLERSSDLFANPDDPLTVSAFDPSIRGKTTKFVLLFSKR